MDKSKQVETKENNLIGLPEIYKRLWECRDFELSTLWQRSVFLGAFMLAAYAGYGVLILNAIGTAKGVKWTLLNLMAMGVCWLGVVLAALWIMMLKGSKTWYEIYETAIDDFGKKYPMAFQKIPHDTECTIDCAALSGFGFVWSCKRHRGVAWSDNLFTCEGGCYSVSRVAMLIGRVSLIGWLGLSFIHLVFILKGREAVRQMFLDGRTVAGVAVAVLSLTVLCLWWLVRKAHSSTLEDYVK